MNVKMKRWGKVLMKVIGLLIIGALIYMISYQISYKQSYEATKEQHYQQKSTEES